jgi:hypothetical protein
MIPVSIMQKFKDLSLVEDEDIVCWFPNGRGSVRVRTKSYGDLVFTYASKKRWRIETVDSYLESIKIEK